MSYEVYIYNLLGYVKMCDTNTRIEAELVLTDFMIDVLKLDSYKNSLLNQPVDRLGYIKWSWDI